MNGKPKVQSILESIFTGAIDTLIKADSGHLVEALYVQLDLTAGEIQVYDDREVLLEKNIIFEWAELAGKNVRIYKQAVHFIRVALAAIRSRKIFDNPVFMRPFRVSIVDDDMNELETVFTIEGSDGVAEGRLLKNLEQELQIFSQKIFADLN
jgi:hypothetical protein